MLDLFFVNDSKYIKLCIDQYTLIEQSQQDVHHVPYEILFDYCKTASTHRAETQLKFIYSRGNYQRLCQQIDNINFQHEFNVRDVNSAFDFFHRTISALIESNVPKKSITRNPNKPKWWTRELQCKKNRRDKLFKRKPKGTLTEDYAVACREFNELNDALHKQYIDKIQSDIKTNPADFWKFAKIGNKHSTYPNQMRYSDNCGHSLEEIVELFANYFESIYVADDQPWTFNDVFHESYDAAEVTVSLTDIELNSDKFVKVE